MPHSRAQTRAEELANCLTHGLGLLGSLAALPVLVLAAAARRDPWQVVGATVFGVSLVLLYLASTLYHAFTAPRAKHRLRLLDHVAIYLLIAGSYTPFLLGALRGRLGWTLLIVVWTVAVVGIVAKLTLGFRWPHLSTAAYVAMGWLALPAIGPLREALGPTGVTWLLAGGVCYTAGVVFFAWERLRYGHAIWPLFVAGGSACHVVAVLRHALPAGGG